MLLWDAQFMQWHQCPTVTSFYEAKPLVSHLFLPKATSESPPVEFQANSRTYDMGYYLATCRLHLWSQFKHPMVRKNSNFIVPKRRLGKMWSKHLGFCKPNLLLWEDRLGFGIKRSFGTSWMLVWSCITWSLRMSVARMVSMTSWANNVVCVLIDELFVLWCNT
jgi:hypothetical protein